SSKLSQLGHDRRISFRFHLVAFLKPIQFRPVQIFGLVDLQLPSVQSEVRLVPLSLVLRCGDKKNEAGGQVSQRIIF
ncbi:hypothetical protein ILYODFUR_038852, partial [Ilyodon furcidens]